MSTERFDPASGDWGAWMDPCADGDYVLYAAYVELALTCDRLMGENAALKEELQRRPAVVSRPIGFFVTSPVMTWGVEDLSVTGFGVDPETLKGKGE